MSMDLSKPKWDIYEGRNQNPEHDLFSQLCVEYVDIFGINANYYVRYNTDQTDQFYGETPSEVYRAAESLKVLYEPTEEISILNAFGISSDETIQYIFIPKDLFKRDVSESNEPNAGDVIHTIWNDRRYEIVDVGQEAKIFLFKKQVYELIVRPYRASEESTIADSITTSDPISGWGDNAYIGDQSDDIDDYDDVDESIFGY